MKWLIDKLVGAALGPITSLGEKWIEEKSKREAIDAGREKIAIEADAAVRQIKLGTLLGRLPLFVAEIAVAGYIASILIDSTFPSPYLNPLELPEWFKPHFATAVASIFGIATFERVFKRTK